MIRRVHWITNPKGGVRDNLALAHRARDILQEHGISSEIVVTQHEGHARKLVEELNFEDGHVIGGIGGDGTMHELINGLMQRPERERMPLTLLPGGTGNSFLRDLGCLDPVQVLKGLRSPARRLIDLFEVQIGDSVHYGFNIVGWALFSYANELAESLRWIGRRRYDVAAFIRLMQNRHFEAHLEFDGQVVEGCFAFLAASNTVHTGDNMKLAPRAQLDDGKLDLVYLRNVNRRTMLSLFKGLKEGRHVDSPEVKYYHVSEFTLRTEEELSIVLDGELIEGGSCSVRVLPGSLELLI